MRVNIPIKMRVTLKDRMALFCHWILYIIKNTIIKDCITLLPLIF